jgi:hypothetical protein
MRAPAEVSQRLSAMEADVAYFEARLTLVGEDPTSVYQRAQLKVFRTLTKLSHAALSKRRAAAAE